MAESSQPGEGGRGSGAAAPEALRPRMYKAVRATILGQEGASPRRETLARWLRDLFQEGPQKLTFPEELAEAQQAAFQAGLERAVNRGRSLAGAWFSWDALPGWLEDLKQAVSQVAQGDEAPRSLSPGPDLTDQELSGLLLHRLRQRWCGGPAAAETCRIDAWLREVALVSRQPLEIGTFARLFHTVALYYREGLAAPEERRTAWHRVVKKVTDGRPLKNLEELVIYLEGQASPGGEATGPRAAPPVDPELFPGQDLRALCQLLREALNYLARGDGDPAAKARLEWLSRRRDFIDLKDLLLAFLSRAASQDPLPPPTEVLDLLQLQGFPIQHRDFRDEYRARLAPLTALGESSAAALRFPLDPSLLTGDAATDLDRLKEQDERRRLWLAAFQEEALAFLAGRGEPLPRVELIRPAARFAVTWLAAARCRAGEPFKAGTLAEEAAGLMPGALLKLIRPRKGYELQHKGQLTRLLRLEAEAFEESLSRSRSLGRIISSHDERLLFRLAAAATLAAQTREAPLAAGHVQALDPARVDSALTELAAGLSLDLEPARAPLWYEFREWLRDKLNWPTLVALGEDLGLPARRWEAAAARLVDDLAHQLYRLVVARARAECGHPPLPGDRQLLFWLAAWFTPERQAFWEGASYQLLDAIRTRARRAVWESYPLAVESREELVSLIRFFLDEEMGGRSLEDFARSRRLSLLPEKVAARLQRCQIPPEVLDPGGLEAAVQEVLRPRAPEASQAQRRLEEEVLSWLPRTDCGSCGSPGCLTFARLLVQGRSQPSQCLQSSPEARQRLAAILAQAPPLALTPEPYALTEEDCTRLTSLLDPYFQAWRQVLAQELAGDGGRGLVPLSPDEVSILQLGKSPDAATFHRYLEDYLGREAAARLSPADLEFLGEHGSPRLAAEAQELEDSFSWLEQETRAGLSGAALARKDPAGQARAAYARALYLSDLSADDQRRVQEFRLHRFLPDFLRDWEEALPEHWQAGYRLEDWRDFAHIVAKSYWHQEHTPAPGELLRDLPPETAAAPRLEELGNSFWEGLVQEELAALDGRRRRLEALLHRRRVAAAADLDFLAQGLTARAWQELAGAPGSPGLAPLVERGLALLDTANLAVSGDLRAYWDEMSPRVRQILHADPQVAPPELARLQAGAGGLAWREMHTLRQGWLKALVQAAAASLLAQEQEAARFEQGELPAPTPGALRRAVRQLYLSGLKTGEDIRQALSACLDRYPGGREALGEAALFSLTWERLESRAFLKKARPEEDPLTRALDRLLKARVALDLKKLKAYMFLLARMEGNLDKLTALLREIRETSDVIEAAWLSFTEERAHQAAAAPASPGGPIPLLAGRLPEAARFNRFLAEGLPRGEPRDYTQAYWELRTLLEFYVVTAPPEASPAQVLATLESGPYDLTGLSRDALLAALTALAGQRERLLPRKISICTYVLGHQLAAGHSRLAADEARFLQEKSAFLKVEGLPAELHKGILAGRRGVELGKIRNELYLKLSDLLTEERTGSFARRIGQIIDRLEEERAATLAAFRRGELNRLTAFYILRRFQKDRARVAVPDLCRFLRQYQPEKLAALRARLAPQVAAQVNRRLEEMVASYRAALAG